MISFFPALPLEAVNESKLVACEVDGVSVVLALDSTQRVHAFENNCPHADKPLLGGRWSATHCEVTCPFHKAVFDISNGGRVVSGPSCLPVQVLNVEIRGHQGQQFVYVGLDTSD